METGAWPPAQQSRPSNTHIYNGVLRGVHLSLSTDPFATSIFGRLLSFLSMVCGRRPPRLESSCEGVQSERFCVRRSPWLALARRQFEASPRTQGTFAAPCWRQAVFWGVLEQRIKPLSFDALLQRVVRGAPGGPQEPSMIKTTNFIC